MNNELKRLNDTKVSQAEEIKALHRFSVGKFEQLQLAVFGLSHLKLAGSFANEMVGD